ncbi:ABC transporter permease [Clostridium sp. DL1XJH146]
MGLFRFEVKKIISSKKTIILWIIGAILISSYAFMSDKTDKSIKSSKINIYTDLIDDLNVNLLSLNNQIRMQKDPLTKEAMKQTLNRSEENIRLNEEIKQGIIDNDYNKILKTQVKMLQNEKDGIVSGTIVSPTSLQEIESEIEKYTYLINNEIEPINDGMTMNGVNFINLVLKNIAPMLLGVIIILSTADIVSKEIDYGTIQTLIFQKVSKRKIIISKLLSCILINILYFGTILIGIAIFLSFKNGIGSFNYPSIVEVDGILKIYPVSNLILKSVVITLFYIVFLSCFSTLISILSKNSVESICISITICIGLGILFNKIELPRWVETINPFNYLTGNEILKTGFSSSTITPDVHELLIISVFLLYSITIVLLSLVIFNKKQFDIES